MKQTALWGIAALMLTLVVSCNGCQKGGQGTSDKDSDSIAQATSLKDSTLYAILGDGTGMSCVELVTDGGDTLSLEKEDEQTGELAKICGDQMCGNRYAFTMNADSSRLISLVNLTQLSHAWVQPIPGMKGQQGFELKADNKAESINMATLPYKTWKIANGKLVLNGESVGNGQTFEISDTASIDKLTDDSLVLNYGTRVDRFARKK